MTDADVDENAHGAGVQDPEGTAGTASDDRAASQAGSAKGRRSTGRAGQHRQDA
jgi:hypothetical protein